MDFRDYDAMVSGLSDSPWIQGFDVASMQVPVASGVSPSQPAGATVKQSGPGMVTNGKPLMSGGILGQPYKWWLILLGLYLVLNWLAKRYDVPRFSLVQLGILTLHYVVVLTALKVVLTRFTVPGLSPIVIAV